MLFDWLIVGQAFTAGLPASYTFSALIYAATWRCKLWLPRSANLQSELLGSSLPDISGQENRGGSAGQTSEPKHPGAELRCPAELIERDAEQECPEEPAAKADAGIHPDRCSSVPRGGNGEDTRSEIGEVALYDEAGDHGQA
jgi:hypothetical protein